MNIQPCRLLAFTWKRLPTILALVAAFASSALGQTATGRITGIVTNSTGNAYLEGAVVTVDGANRTTTTDRRGEFDFGALAPGAYSVRITYTGMTPVTARAVVVAGQTATLTATLSEDVIQMGAFSVVTNRNADALAVTEQRHAPNVKNVVDIQAYGMLNNDNPAELLQLLPGVTGSIFFNETDRVSIRGMSSALNNIQLDGNSFATPSINGSVNDRSSILSTTNTNNIKSAEVIKAITPDRSADAIGGMVNLIQRSALDYPKSAGRFEYRVGGQYVNTRSGFETRPTPNAQLTYHSTFGGKRDWGVFLTGGMHKEATNQLRAAQNIVANATFGAIPTMNQGIENDRFRYRKNWSATIDHRRGGAHEFALKYKHDNWTEFTESVITTLNGAVPAPNWTRDVRAYSTANMVVGHNNEYPFTRADSLSFEGKHRFDSWEVTYTGFHSKARLRNIRPSGGSEGVVNYGTHTATLLTGLRPSYVADSSRDRLFPKISFTSANPDALFNPDNYTLAVTQNWQFRDDLRSGGRLDVKRAFAWKLPTTFKAGISRNDQSRLSTLKNNQRSFVGEDRVLGLNAATGRSDDRLSRFVNPNPSLTGYSDVGNRRPFMFDHAAINRNFAQQPQLWVDDVYGNTLRALQSNYKAEEEISAGYALAESDWGKFRFLAGVRWEETKVTGTGVFTNPIQATAAQIPDPVQRAINNAGTNIKRTSTYRNTFPSVHLLYKFRPELQLRASYSTGIGRPGFSAIVPNTTVNEQTDVVTTANPGLRPQFADSYDLSLEYYTEPAGLVSLGVFRKDISDYIVSQIGVVPPGFPLGEQYVGYELRTSVNGGSAKVQGLEFNLVRQLNFIPRQIGLFTFKGNLTVLTAEGDFGTGSRLRSGQVPGFIPRAWNIVGEYARGRFYSLVRYNQQAAFPVGATANPVLATTNPRREKIDVNLGYRWRKSCEFFFAIDNLTERPSYQLLGIGDRQYASAVWAGSRRFNFGVQGKF
ncbi:MAG: TonB-dependent receptor [Opitutaceae bacterium]|nr:TonB-dependent receptor [Opitutaceae bacterium]